MITTVAQTDTFDAWRITTNTMIGRWNALGEASAVTITGGAIDNTTIGGSTPSASFFTNCTVNSTLDIRGGSFLLDDDSISADKISGGSMDITQVTLSSAPTLGTHATTKTYVDDGLATAGEDAVALAIALG